MSYLPILTVGEFKILRDDDSIYLEDLWFGEEFDFRNNVQVGDMLICPDGQKYVVNLVKSNNIHVYSRYRMQLLTLVDLCHEYPNMIAQSQYTPFIVKRNIKIN